MQKRLAIASIAALFLVPALALAQKVSYDFNKTANFASFRTYAHKDGTRVGRKSATLEAAAPIKMNEATIGYLFVETNR